MHVTRITSAAELQRPPFREAWNALSCDVPFRRWEWLASWWHHFGKSENNCRELYLLRVTRGGGTNEKVVALAPWYIERSMTQGRVVRFLGSGRVCSDYLSVLTQPEDEEEVAEALADWLTRANDSGFDNDNDSRWDLLDLDGIDADDTMMQKLVERLQHGGSTVFHCPGENCWRIALPETWDAYMAMLSKSHRKQMRRCERRKEAAGNIRFYTVENREQLQHGFEVLVRLHEKRRQSLGEVGCFQEDHFADFLREAIQLFFEAGQLRLSWIERAGHPIAADLQLMGDGVTYAYQSGVDPEFLADEPGRIIQKILIERAIAEGQQAFDFLRGDESYKPHWRAIPRENLHLRIVPKKMIAQTRHQAWLAKQQMKSWIKKSLSVVGMY